MAEEYEDWKVAGGLPNDSGDSRSKRGRINSFTKPVDDTPECGQKGRANAADAPVPEDCHQRLL